jgi:hypothetical protein
MKVLLINIDSTIPNLALNKCEMYHLERGDEVIWDMPLFALDAERTYVSCIFPENKNKCLPYTSNKNVFIGGSGWDINAKLPPEIDAMKPKINWGFTTRGCIRNCYFCYVPKMEGMIRVVGDIYDFWDGKSKEITIMDNNILALPEHFKMICQQIRKEKLRVDFNQGLDCRLVTDEIAKDILSIKHIQEIRFAFDDIRTQPQVEKCIQTLRRNGLKDWGTRWYCYVSPTDTFENVYKRMKFLQDNKQAVYVMRDKEITKKPEFIALASWGNTMGAFKQDIRELLKQSERMRAYKKYFKEVLEKGF